MGGWDDCWDDSCRRPCRLCCSRGCYGGRLLCGRMSTCARTHAHVHTHTRRAAAAAQPMQPPPCPNNTPHPAHTHSTYSSTHTPYQNAPWLLEHLPCYTCTRASANEMLDLAACNGGQQLAHTVPARTYQLLHWVWERRQLCRRALRGAHDGMTHMHVVTKA